MEQSMSVGVSSALADVPALVGTHLGYTEWREMTQPQVDQFADLTNDHNFIHVDPERARDTPFGGTIAHGFFTLALLAEATQRLQVPEARTSVNYGLDRVRFPAPLPVGAQWRGGAEVVETTEISGGIQVRMRATVEVRGIERPAVVADFLARFYA